MSAIFDGFVDFTRMLVEGAFWIGLFLIITFVVIVVFLFVGAALISAAL